MIDIRTHGAVAGGDPKTNGTAIVATLTECRAKNQPLYVPDGMFDTDRPIFFGTSSLAPVAVVGDGNGGIRRGPNWPVIVNGQGRHLAVWDKCATSVVRGVSFDGNAAAYETLNSAALNGVMVGDTVRAQFITQQVDHQDMHVLNSVGLTTSSTTTLPETFAAQYLRCTGKVMRARCWAVQADGGRGATGIVSHWCDDFTDQDSVVFGFSHGQGYGTFGGSKAQVRFRNAHSIKNNHGFNIEAGSGGIGTVTIGDPTDPAQNCTSDGDSMGLVSNGNYNARIETLNVYGLTVKDATNAVVMTGVAPGKMLLDHCAIIDPYQSAVRFLTNAAANSAALWLNGSTLHSSRTGAVSVKGGTLTHGTFTLV